MTDVRFIDYRGLLSRAPEWGQGGPGIGGATMAPHAAVVPRRILILLHDLSGGGSERVAIRLANEWTRAGRVVTLFCGSSEGDLRPLVGQAVRLVEAEPECRRAVGSRFRLSKALIRFVELNPQDVVFAPGNFHLPALSRFAARTTGRALTVCKISNPLVGGPAFGAGRWLRSWAVRRLTAPIDCLVAMSPGLREEASRLVGPDKLMLAWEPILETGDPVDSALPPPARPVVLIVGRLEPQKDLMLALEAFSLLVDDTDADLLILGEGNERGRLERRVAALGIDRRVSMPGFRASISNDLQRASVLLLTSRFEGYPAVMVEAVAAGIPVVTTACSPAIPEILANCPLSIVTASRSAAVAAALRMVLAADRPAVGDASRLLKARHAISKAAADYLGSIDAACAERPRLGGRRFAGGGEKDCSFSGKPLPALREIPGEPSSD